MSSVYQINKGINKSLEFKGLKAQYIWYFGAVVMLLFLLYGMMYFIGVHTYLSLGIIAISGTISIIKVYALSNKYGEHGMMKALARKMIPKVIQCNSRKVYRKLHQKGRKNLCNGTEK